MQSKHASDIDDRLSQLDEDTAVGIVVSAVVRTLQAAKPSWKAEVDAWSVVLFRPFRDTKPRVRVSFGYTVVGADTVRIRPGEIFDEQIDESVMARIWADFQVALVSAKPIG